MAVPTSVPHFKKMALSGQTSSNHPSIVRLKHTLFPHRHCRPAESSLHLFTHVTDRCWLTIRRTEEFFVRCKASRILSFIARNGTFWFLAKRVFRGSCPSNFSPVTLFSVDLACERNKKTEDLPTSMPQIQPYPIILHSWLLSLPLLPFFSPRDSIDKIHQALSSLNF